MGSANQRNQRLVLATHFCGFVEPQGLFGGVATGRDDAAGKPLPDGEPDVRHGNGKDGAN